MTPATKHKPLGELYLGTLVEDSSYYTLAGTIATAVLHDCQRPNRQISNDDIYSSAATMTRHAMGMLEHCISLISDDQLFCFSDVWARIDAFFDKPSTDPAELAWVIKELRQQSYRVFEDWEKCAAEQRKGDAEMGIEFYKRFNNPESKTGLWIAELYGAGHLLQAASKVLKEVKA